MEQPIGKLVVFASNSITDEKCLKLISIAAKRTAEALKLGFEAKTLVAKSSMIYVYFKSGRCEAIPIYCTHGAAIEFEEVCTNLRKMMFVLSFHPKLQALRHVREELMQFS